MAYATNCHLTPSQELGILCERPLHVICTRPQLQKIAPSLCKEGQRQLCEREGEVLVGCAMLCSQFVPCFAHSLLNSCRLFERELEYIVNHAKDEYIMLDVTFVDLVVKMQDRFPSVKGYIILTDRQHMPKHSNLHNMLCYDDLLQVSSYVTLQGNTAALRAIFFTIDHTDFSVIYLSLSAALCLLQTVPTDTMCSFLALHTGKHSRRVPSGYTLHHLLCCCCCCCSITVVSSN